MRSTGLSVTVGSWKTIEISSPRRRRISASERVNRSVPLNRIEPPVILFKGTDLSTRSGAEMRQQVRPLEQNRAARDLAGVIDQADDGQSGYRLAIVRLIDHPGQITGGSILFKGT